MRTRFDKDQLIAFGMGFAEPEQADRDATKVDRRFPVESHVRPAQYNACEQLSILLRNLPEQIDDLQPIKMRS